MAQRTSLAYEPLAEGEIRVVRIKTGSPTEPIRCAIRHVSLASQPVFVAVSYVWGDPNKASSADPEGQALVDLEQVNFWIDAICINQADGAEKAAQIPQMDRIYSSAMRVLGWLGANEAGHMDHNVKVCFEIVQEVLYEPRVKDGISEGEAISAMTARCRSLLDAGVITADRHTGILCLLHKRDWFSRAWIIQEAVLGGPNLVYMAGAYWAPACGLELYMRAWRPIAGQTRNGYVFWSVLGLHLLPSVRDWFYRPLAGRTAAEPQGDNTRASGVSEFAQDLERLISMTGAYKSTLPHDTVYARLSLCRRGGLPPAQRGLIVPDYDTPFEDVFHKYASLCIPQTRTLSLLMTTQHHLAPGKVPSWVPDLRYARGNIPKATASEQLCISPDGKVLTVEGYVLGRIDRVSKCCVSDQEDLSAIAAAVEAFHRDMMTYLGVQKAAGDSDRVLREVWLPMWAHGTEGGDDKNLPLFRTLYHRLLHSKGAKLSWEMLPPSEWPIFWFLSTFLHRDSFITEGSELGDVIPGEVLRQDSGVEKGDLLCAVKGLSVPMILRENLECRGSYLYVGCCTVGGKELYTKYGNDKLWERPLETYRLV